MNPCSWRVAAALLQTAGKAKQLPQQQWVFVKHTQPNKGTEHMQHIFCIGEGASVCAAVQLMTQTNCRTWSNQKLLYWFVQRCDHSFVQHLHQQIPVTSIQNYSEVISTFGPDLREKKCSGSSVWLPISVWTLERQHVSADVRLSTSNQIRRKFKFSSLNQTSEHIWSESEDLILRF